MTINGGPQKIHKCYISTLRGMNMSLNWQEAGDKSKKTIILVHGAGGSSATWFMQLKGLSKHLHVVAIDLNGHGGTRDRSEGNVESSYMQDIEYIVSKYDAPILGGHSMGGALAQLYALRHPEHLNGVVLISTGARLKVAPMVFELLENDFDGYIAALGTYMFHETSSEEMIEASKQEVRKCPPRIIRRDFELCNEFDIMQEVSSIQVPALIIVGTDDVMTPVKYADYLHQSIRQSTLKIIEAAGHMVMLEQDSAVNSAIAGWVSSLS
jgi:pimeloyl-ACP methyl ester carboxylesterase